MTLKTQHGADIATGQHPATHTPFIPSLKIAMYYQSDACGDVMRQAAADRLLFRAEVNVLPGTMSAAISDQDKGKLVDILMIEDVGPVKELHSKLELLAEVCAPDTQVVIIGAHNDVDLFRDLMSKGLSDYLVQPLRPGVIVDCLVRMSASHVLHKPGKVVVFCGAGGGVGSSTIAQNTAALMARDSPEKTLLIDLDLAFGTIAMNLDQDPRQTVIDALAEGSRLDGAVLERIAIQRSERLLVVPSPATLALDDTPTQEQLTQLIDVARIIATYVLVDLPSGWSDMHKQMLLLADEVIVTARPNLISLRNAQSLSRTIGRIRANDRAPQIVINMTGVRGERQLSADDFAKATGSDTIVQVPFVPAALSAAQVLGKLAIEANTATKFGQSISQIARGISMSTPHSQEKSAKKGWLETWLRGRKPAK